MTVVVTAPEITIRAGSSHFPCAGERRPAPARGQHHTITPIPPNATSAPTTGGNATIRATTPSPT